MRLPTVNHMKYMKDKLRLEEQKKKRREEVKNEFLFDNELHKEMAKCQYGRNPYQE